MSAKDAFMNAMLQGADAQPAQAPDQAAAAPPQPKMENPQNSGPDGQLYLGKDMFAELDCKVGDEVMVKCKIDSKGDKYGLTPIAVSEQNVPESDEDDSGLDAQ